MKVFAIFYFNIMISLKFYACILIYITIRKVAVTLANKIWKLFFISEKEHMFQTLNPLSASFISLSILIRMFSLLQNQSDSSRRDKVGHFFLWLPSVALKSLAVNQILSPFRTYNYQPKPSDSRYYIFSPSPQLDFSFLFRRFVWLLVVRYPSTEWCRIKWFWSLRFFIGSCVIL